MSVSGADVVVIGAGHNGLVCAFHLARAGLDVVVLERANVVGGAAVTEEFHPGFRNSVASYTVSLLAPKIIAEMRLFEHGLRILPRPVANFVPQLDGPGLELHHAPDRTCAAIAAHSAADAERHAAFAAELAGITRFVRKLLLEAPLDLRAGWREWLRAAAFLPRIRELLRPPGLAAASWTVLTGSAGDWLDRWFSTDVLKGALGFDAIVGHYASPYTPGSGYLLLHHALGESNGVPGAWGHAVGGMGAVTRAMAAAAEAAGARIRLLGERVERVRRDGNSLTVVTASGAELTARAVAGAIHPRILFDRLIEPSELPQAFRERIAAWRSESASFRMNVALAELPDFSCRRGIEPAAPHGAGILIAPSLGYLERAHSDTLAHGYSRSPVIEMLMPSTLDDSLAPQGAHVASLFCQHFPRRLADGRSWADETAGAVDTIIDTVTCYAPNFRDAVLLVQALSPADLEARFALVGGDIFHGQMTLDQLYWARPAPGYAQYRSPVRGVYLCAAGAHPGGGVSGAPGHNAAAAMLRDLGAAGRRRAPRRSAKAPSP